MIALLMPRRREERARFGEARAADLAQLRARFRAQPTPREASGPERAFAAALPALKRAVAEAYGDVRSCAGCAQGCAAPAGRWQGGVAAAPRR